jgi:hypothetical protein
VSAAKLYIQTYGCQMNEHDSARMADLLRVSHGMADWASGGGRRRAAAEHLLDPREGAGEGLLPARALAALEAARGRSW